MSEKETWFSFKESLASVTIPSFVIFFRFPSIVNSFVNIEALDTTIRSSVFIENVSLLSAPKCSFTDPGVLVFAELPPRGGLVLGSMRVSLAYFIHWVSCIITNFAAFVTAVILECF